MNNKLIKIWLPATLLAVLYCLFYKTVMTAWINPRGNAFTFKEFAIASGEALISIGSLYVSYRLTNVFLSNKSIGFRYAVILLVSIVINAVLFLLYWVLFTRLFLYGLSTDKAVFLPEVSSRTWALHLPISVIIIITLYNYYSQKARMHLLGVEKVLAETQLKNLQQQVDPHFLFNSLNILTALIKIDPYKSVTFTQHLAEIYRFFLKNQKEILVSLKEELDFLQSYFYLVKVRFGKAFDLQIQSQANIGFEKIYIIPGTLQLLVENVVKHNAADESYPTLIEIFIENSKLTVSNRIAKKENTSFGFGLDNLAKRYTLLNKETVTYSENNERFIVHIPLAKNISQL